MDDNQQSGADSELPEETLAERFERQVGLRPDATAVTENGCHTTYSQLNERANQLAHHLRARGVGSDAVVGVCLPRSTEMIVAMLGILKAGGAYLAIDPRLPPARNTYMIDLAECPFVVTSREWQPETDSAAKWIFIDDPGIQACSRENPSPSTRPHHLACVIYTSGSTGRPKGIEITNRNIIRLVHDPVLTRLGSRQVVLHVSAVTFDASTYEIWTPLLNGGRCVVFPHRVPTPDLLREAIARDDVTSLLLTTALFNVVVDTDASALLGLSELFFGGERHSDRHVMRARQQLPGTALVQLYGPAEATTVATSYEITEKDDAADTVPIGYPVDRTRAYVLDADRQPVPAGATGELYLAGAGLARGYINRPDLTTVSFVPDPFVGTAGQTMYRTGDLAMRRDDGALVFMGRTDNQVKIRGQRVELDEIARCAMTHPAVRQATVTAVPDTGGLRIVCYLVVEPSAGDPVPNLRHHLEDRLPEYMVPAAFMPVPQIPLTHNGKIDWKSLPAVTIAPPHAPAEAAAPKTERQKTLTDIYRNVLDLDAVGIHDAFFELGGHSLLAIEVVRRANEQGLPIDLLDVFERQTVAAIVDGVGVEPGRD